MSDVIAWTHTVARMSAARQAWRQAVPSFLRALLVSVTVTAFTCFTAHAIAPEVLLPVLSCAAAALGIPCILLLVPLGAFILPETRYKITAAGMMINGRRIKWHRFIEFAHGSQEQTLVAAHCAGVIHEIHLPDPPIRERVLLAIPQWSGVEIQFTPSLKTPIFSRGDVASLLCVAATNALLTAALVSLLHQDFPLHSLGLILLAASLPSGILAALLAWFRHPRFTLLPLALAYIVCGITSGMSVIFVVACVVKTHAFF